jgi:uncharacterized membrane protein YhaH (DUF805 family)
MNLRELIGSYNDIKGKYSRSQYLWRELVNGAYLLLIMVAVINHYRVPLLVLLALLPIEQVLYRLSVIRRLHDLDVPRGEVNTTFWMPLCNYKTQWRILFEKGR